MLRTFLTNQNQAEAMADNFSQISDEYEPLKAEDINLDGSTANQQVPILEEYQVYEYLKKIRTKSSKPKDDVPLANIINCSVARGEFADIHLF